MEFSNTWIAFCREAGIAGQSISAGLDALRKANYAQASLYSHAFFSLSVGFERHLKLIYIVDFAVTNNGKYPTEIDLRNKFGHDLEKLFSHSLEVRRRLKSTGDTYVFERGGIQEQIIMFLSRFAKTTRYYNLDYLVGGKSVGQTSDPIKDWYQNIGTPILKKHYSVKSREKNERFARTMNVLLGDSVMVRHTAEDGTNLNNLEDASLQTAGNEVAQKFGTFYCATIARFFFTLLYDLEHAAHHLEDIPALHEFFFPFLNDDKYLLSRKTFPPRGQGR